MPDLCNVQAVFSLILVGELLAFAFVVIDQGLVHFNWLYFGSVSFLVQWVILASAACLCPLRPWFRNQNGWVAGTVSYCIVLLMTLVFSLMGEWLSTRAALRNFHIIFENLAIAAIFAGVVLRYFYLQQQLHNREQAELRSRIQALQSRIRPHFLFNSMNSIASLIDSDPKAAEKTVLDLSQLFRASLKESTFVSLQDEIQLCKQFVSIEKTRLGDRLQTNWDIDFNQLQPRIPSLLLQPLIENAIYHGIQALPEGGDVDIVVKVDREMVRLEVRNPLAASREAADKQSNGIALDNIRHRLQAHFGEKAQMKCQQREKEFVVTLRYPTQPMEENNNAYLNR